MTGTRGSTSYILNQIIMITSNDTWEHHLDIDFFPLNHGVLKITQVPASRIDVGQNLLDRPGSSTETPPSYYPLTIF